MNRTKRTVVLVATVMLGIGAAAEAAPPVDLYGDPLPPGCTARFGTTRLRVAATSLAITADGRTLVSSDPGAIREWDAATGAAGIVHPLPPAQAYQTLLSPDGKTAAVRGEDGLTLWDARTGERLCKLALEKGHMVTQWAFTADGRTLATAEYAGAGGPIRLWNVTDGKGRLLAEHGALADSLAIDSDGKRLAAYSSQDGTLCCWDTADGKELWQTKVEAYELAFSPDGRTLISSDATADSSLQLLDAATGRPAEGHKVPTLSNVRAIRFGSHAAQLAVADADGVLLWDLHEGKELHRFPGAAGPLVFSPDGKTLTGLVAQSLQRWDLASGKALYPDAASLGHVAPVEALAYSADGKLLASAALDKTIRIWDVASSRVLHTLTGPFGHGWVWVAFTPDGATLVSGGANDTVRFWSVREGKEVRRLEWRDSGADKTDQPLQSFHLASDGKSLVVVFPNADPTGQVAMTGRGGTGTFAVWDVSAGKQQLHRIVQNPRHTYAFSADGRWMAVEDGAIYDTATGDKRLELQSTFFIGLPFGDAFAFSPDGALVAASLGETVVDGNRHSLEMRGIQVWELATGAPVARIPVKGFCRFAFAPDSRTLATVGPDDIALWDAASAQELCRRTVDDHLIGPYGSPFAIAPDGRSLALGATDTTILTWDLSPAYADAPVAKALTAAEADDLWADLAGADATKAYAAIKRLAARPAESVALLRDRLHAVPPVPVERLKQWIADLDSDDFSVREEASRQLAALSEQAIPVLREALKHGASAESRQRITALLKAPLLLHPGDHLRGVRAVRVLERVDSPAARLVLKTLAEGDPAAAVTQEAEDALTRAGAGD